MTDTPAWRRSSYSSGQGGECVELAPLPDGTIAIRNSNRPELGTLTIPHTEFHTWLAAAKRGEFDHSA